MYSEWKASQVVGQGGRIELLIPELHEGERVEVSVRRDEESAPDQRPLGILKGRVEIMPGFDDPIEGFGPLD